MAAVLGSAVSYSFPVSSVTKAAKGVVVEGCATDGSVDHDRQIVDPGFSGPALEAWLRSGGNVRMSHDGHRPVGKGIAVEVDKDGSGQHWVRSLVVAKEVRKLVESGVLGSYSVGIADPVIVRDPAAPGGRIVSGSIIELSLVDRPANASCKFTVVKSAGGRLAFVGKMARVEPGGYGAYLEKLAGDGNPRCGSRPGGC